MSEGGESIEQLTIRTLDSNYPFAEDVKLPVNFTVEEYSYGLCSQVQMDTQESSLFRKRNNLAI